MNFEFFSMNGELVPIGEATVSLSNIEYQYGFGVYETIRVTNGIPYFLDEHVERLLESARIIGLTHQYGDILPYRSSTENLVHANNITTCNLKILLIGGREPSLYILPFNPLFPDKKLYRDGADFVTYEYERPFPHAKSLNMLQSYLAYKKAKEAGAYDALLMNKKGCITEGTRTNFFCIKGKVLVSPPEDEILLGVTRKAVLAVAEKNGYTFETRDIPLTDIATYDSALITSTSSKIIPVRSIDRATSFTPARELRELMKLFDDYLANCGGIIETSAGR